VERWPNFFIVGAAKAGTTTLIFHLSDIPEIFMSPIIDSNYFSSHTLPLREGQKSIRDKKKYLSFFKKVKDEKIIEETSHRYFVDPESPKLIHQVLPNARILISLRDPVERSYSQYLMMRRNGQTKLSFYDELQKEKENRDANRYFRILKGSLYSDQVKRYLDIFGPQQVKIIIFEEWTRNTKDTIKEIIGFLGLNSSLDNLKDEIYNQYVEPRGPVAQYILKSEVVRSISLKVMSPSTRKFLREKFIVKKLPKPKMTLQEREFLIEFLRDDVEKLQNILGRKLPWSNFQN